MRHVLKFLTRLPLPVLYALGAFAYFVAFHVLRWHRELAARNLCNAFPEKSAAERARILRQSYVNLGQTLAETFWGFGASAGIHSEKVLRLSLDLPLVVECVDTEEKIQAVLPELDEMIGGGLITLERAHVIMYRGEGQQDGHP